MIKVDVAVVSAYDRGFWLADKLCGQGLKVAVLNGSEALSLPLSEREGPFGVFVPQDLDDLSKQYLYGDQFVTLPKGLCILSPKGPLEMRGPLTPFLLKTRPEFQALKPDFPPAPAPLFKTRKSRALKKDSVLWQVATGLCGANLQSHSPAPLFSEYILRQTSSRYFEETYRSFQDRGIICQTVDELKDLQIQNHKVWLKGQDFELSARFLVWTFSGPESQKILKTGVPGFFPSVKQVWKRTPLLWNRGGFKDTIPRHLLILNPPPSTGFVSLKSLSAGRAADLWTLRPFSETEGETNRHSAEVLKELSVRLRGCSFEMKKNTTPRGGYFVLCEKGGIRKKPACLFYLNPEGAGGFDALSLLRHSVRIFKAICL